MTLRRDLTEPKSRFDHPSRQRALDKEHQRVVALEERALEAEGLLLQRNRMRIREEARARYEGFLVGSRERVSLADAVLQNRNDGPNGRASQKRTKYQLNLHRVVKHQKYGVDYLSSKL